MTDIKPGRSSRPVVVGEMREATEPLRLLVERVRDYAIFLLDPEGNVASWNEGLQRIKGYTAKEIIGKHMSIFYTPEDFHAGLPQRLLQIARTEGQVESEGWRMRKDGSRFWADVLITALHDDDGNLRGFGKVTRDLTERKAAEDALSELSGRLIAVQDEERRRIGRELHDSTSPLLTSLIGKLYQAQKVAREGTPEVQRLVGEAIMMAEATGTMVRTVSSMLHPQLLDQGGLLVTLRWYSEAFASRSGMRISASIPESMERLDRDREVALFRVAQEWLRASHQVRADSVRLNLKPEAEQVQMIIETQTGDWSRNLEDWRRGRGEIGTVISGLRERIRQLGGSMQLLSADPGVALRVRVPFRWSGTTSSKPIIHHRKP